MSKNRKTDRNRKSRPSRGTGGKLTAFLRFFYAVIAVSAIAVSGGAAFDAMKRRVLADRKPYRVRRFDTKIVQVPAFIPCRVARRIAARSLPKDMDFDHPRLCRQIAELAAADGMVKSVRRVSKSRSENDSRVGQVYVDVEFRKPFAIVENEFGSKFFIDRTGIRLPSNGVARYFSPELGASYLAAEVIPPDVEAGRIHYITIRGVKGNPPEAGQKWNSPDLEAGLKLVALFRSRKYGNQITVADVRNFNQGISGCEPELQLYACLGSNSKYTEIRFGRFPRKRDWVVRPERKMRYLDKYVEEHQGRLAGIHDWLDLRYDELHVSPN